MDFKLNFTETCCDDFLNRVNVGIEQMVLLLRINAFRFTGIDKHMLLWQVHIKFNAKPKDHILPQLFQFESQTCKIPELKTNYIIEAYDQLELLGFPLCGYFELLDKLIDDNIKAKDLKHFINRKVSIYGKLITAKPTKTAKGELMHFGTFLDSDGEVFDTVHFPKIAKKYSIASNGVYLIKGEVVNDLGCLSIIADFVERQGIIPDPRYTSLSHKAS